MIKFIVENLFLLFLLVFAQISSAQETVIITREDLVAEGLIDNDYPLTLSCDDKEKMSDDLDELYGGTEKQYIFVIRSDGGTVRDWSLRYRLLHAKKAYRDLDRYFSILMPSNWNNDSTNNIAVVVYYPDFPTLQELYEARDTCADLTGKNRCNHMIFYDKINTYCFPNISRYGPTIFDIFQYLQEQD